MLKEAFVDQKKVSPEISPSDYQFYKKYAIATWHSIKAMVYPSGLPADHLHYLLVDGKPSEMTMKIDRAKSN